MKVSIFAMIPIYVFGLAIEEVNSECTDSKLDLILVGWKKKRRKCGYLKSKGFCKKDVVKSHCPLTCNICDEYRCADTSGSFDVRGDAWTCKTVQDHPRKRIPCNKSKIQKTCRETCNHPCPTSEPTTSPSSIPSPSPTNLPTTNPSSIPSPSPTNLPTANPTSNPSPSPTNQPSECADDVNRFIHDNHGCDIVNAIMEIHKVKYDFNFCKYVGLGSEEACYTRMPKLRKDKKVEFFIIKRKKHIFCDGRTSQSHQIKLASAVSSLKFRSK